jgi:hypothetical protein
MCYLRVHTVEAHLSRSFVLILFGPAPFTAVARFNFVFASGSFIFGCALVDDVKELPSLLAGIQSGTCGK